MKKIWISITIVTLILLVACNTKDAEEEKSKDEYKGKQTQATIINMYLPERVSKPRVTPITHVVIHFSSNVRKNAKDPYQVQDTYEIFKVNGVSSHYVINRSGDIYQFVSEDRVAYHAGKGRLENFPKYENKLNNYSIGIELLAIGTKEEMLPMMTEEEYEKINPIHVGYTTEQYEALKELLKDISNRYDTIPLNREHIIGHDEYAPERKTDPGSLFDWDQLMSKLNE